MHSDESELLAALSKADESVLDEIIRQAEAYLASQLAAGIAADQRAITFTGMVATALALLGGGAIAIGLGHDKELPARLALACLPAIVGFLWGMWLATQASKPVDWHYVGNTPSQWLEDLKSAKPLHLSRAEQAEHYAAGIEANKAILDRQAKSMNMAITVAWRGLIASLIITVIMA